MITIDNMPSGNKDTLIQKHSLTKSVWCHEIFECLNVCMKCLLYYQFYRMNESFVEFNTLLLPTSREKERKNLSEIIFAFMDSLWECVSIAKKGAFLRKNSSAIER